LEVEWEWPSVARFFRRLAFFSRVIRFNMRGEGLSDPVAPRDWQTLEHRAQDKQAVLHAVGSQRTALLGGVFGGQTMTCFAATHPERTAALVLVGTTARFGWAPDYRWVGRPRSGSRLSRWLRRGGSTAPRWHGCSHHQFPTTQPSCRGSPAYPRRRKLMAQRASGVIAPRTAGTR
jgi:pimeloyl-ACP methyl ester carboxylesterase